MITCDKKGGVFICDGRRVLRLLGQQNECLYAQDHRGMLWYRIVSIDGKWCPVAY